LPIGVATTYKVAGEIMSVGCIIVAQCYGLGRISAVKYVCNQFAMPGVCRLRMGI
jgi:hypothetical protein